MVLGKQNNKLRVVGSMMAAGRWPLAALSIESRRRRRFFSLSILPEIGRKRALLSLSLTCPCPPFSVPLARVQGGGERLASVRALGVREAEKKKERSGGEKEDRERDAAVSCKR